MGHARDKQNAITSVYIAHANWVPGTDFRSTQKPETVSGQSR